MREGCRSPFQEKNERVRKRKSLAEGRESASNTSWGKGEGVVEVLLTYL